MARALTHIIIRVNVQNTKDGLHGINLMPSGTEVDHEVIISYQNA